MECSVCSQDFGPDCQPASIPCGHPFCYQCLTYIANRHDQRPLCPSCRNPFTAREITKLFLDIPPRAPPPPPPSILSELIPEPEPEVEEPPLSPEERHKAERLAARMQGVGIEADPEDLAKVLQDVKIWSAGVGEIKDLETQVAMTRLLLSINILNHKSAKVLSSSAAWKRVRRLSKQLGDAHQETITLNGKVNLVQRRANEMKKTLDREATEVSRLKEAGAQKSAKIDDLELRVLTQREESRAALADKDRLLKSLELRIKDLEELRRDARVHALRIEKLERELVVERRQSEAFVEQLKTGSKRHAAVEKDFKDKLNQAKTELQELETEMEQLHRKETAHQNTQDELAEVKRELVQLRQERDHWKDQYFKEKASHHASESASASASGSPSRPGPSGGSSAPAPWIDAVSTLARSVRSASNRSPRHSTPSVILEEGNLIDLGDESNESQSQNQLQDVSNSDPAEQDTDTSSSRKNEKRASEPQSQDSLTESTKRLRISRHSLPVHHHPYARPSAGDTSVRSVSTSSAVAADSPGTVIRKARSSLKRTRADAEEDTSRYYAKGSKPRSSGGKSRGSSSRYAFEDDDDEDEDEIDDDATITAESSHRKTPAPSSAPSSSSARAPSVGTPSRSLKKITELAADPVIELALQRSSPSHMSNRAHSARPVSLFETFGTVGRGVTRDEDDVISSPGPQRKIRRSN